MGKRFCKEDIQFHGNNLPAVNVKIGLIVENVSLPMDLGRVSNDGGKTFKPIITDPRFTWDWIQEFISEDTFQAHLDMACENGFNLAESEAKEIFGSWVKVWSEGRSGGWVVAEGLGAVDSWDAIMVSKWAKWEKICRENVADIPRQVVESIYHNNFEVNE